METFDSAVHVDVKAAQRMLSNSYPKGFADRVGVRDVSGANWRGYSFVVCRGTWNEYGYWDWDTENPLATSFTADFPDAVNKKGKRGAFAEVFKKADIESIIKGINNG